MTPFFMNLTLAVFKIRCNKCIALHSVAWTSGSLNFVLCSFCLCYLIFQNSVYVLYFVPLLLFTGITVSKILEADLFFTIMFLWQQTCKSGFPLGYVMLIISLVMFKATRTRAFKEGTMNIALVPFCIHHECTEAYPKGHSGPVHVSDAQNLLSFLSSQMHRKLSSSWL